MPRPACHLQASNVLAKITVALASLFILSVSAGCASTEIETTGPRLEKPLCEVGAPA